MCLSLTRWRCSDRCLFCPCSHYDQSEARYERNCAENRRERKSVLSFMRDLDRTDIDVFFLVGEGDSAGGEANDAKNDEEYSDDGDWLHGDVTFFRGE
jgi:hypothetical protein